MSIKSIIKEELTDMVRETATQAPASTLVKDDRLRFTQMVNADFNNYEPFTTDFDAGIDRAKITIHWGVSFLVNPEGIFKFIIEVESVEGQYLMQFFDKHTDELKQETPKNIAETQWRFQVDEVAIENGGFLFVRELSFDFKNNLCEVTF
jgi:hypothetical protein